MSAEANERPLSDLQVACTQVTVPLGLLHQLTPEQIERVETLIRGYKPVRVSLLTDGLMNGAALFCLYEQSGRPIINGLIEPDGRAHT